MFPRSKVQPLLTGPLARAVQRRFEQLKRGLRVETGKLLIDRQRISYVKTGNGPHAVLCLPGSLGSAVTDFKPQLEMLDKDEFSIVAWDPPGYGQSRPPNRDFFPGFFNRDANMAHKLMEILGVPNYSLLGWSGGGVAALILAAMYPENVRKCVVWGACAYTTKEDVEFYEKIRDIDSWSVSMRTSLLEMYGEEYLRRTWSEWVDAFRLMYEKGGDICQEEVRRVSCPSLVVHGAEDPIISPQHPQFLVNNIPDCRLITFPKGKHNVHLKYPEQFNKMVSDFLTQEEGEESSCSENELLLKRGVNS